MYKIRNLVNKSKKKPVIISKIFTVNILVSFLTVYFLYVYMHIYYYSFFVSISKGFWTHHCMPLVSYQLCVCNSYYPISLFLVTWKP